MDVRELTMDDFAATNMEEPPADPVMESKVVKG